MLRVNDNDAHLGWFVLGYRKPGFLPVVLTSHPNEELAKRQCENFKQGGLQGYTRLAVEQHNPKAFVAGKECDEVFGAYGGPGIYYYSRRIVKVEKPTPRAPLGPMAKSCYRCGRKCRYTFGRSKYQRCAKCYGK